MRWGRNGGGVGRDMMLLHNWGYLWHHCERVTAPKYGEWHSESGRTIAPMCDRRGSVGGRAISCRHAKWDSVGGRDTTPMYDGRDGRSRWDTAPSCDKWDDLTGQYGWW